MEASFRWSRKRVVYELTSISSIRYLSFEMIISPLYTYTVRCFVVVVVCAVVVVEYGKKRRRRGALQCEYRRRRNNTKTKQTNKRRVISIQENDNDRRHKRHRSKALDDDSIHTQSTVRDQDFYPLSPLLYFLLQWIVSPFHPPILLHLLFYNPPCVCIV